MISILSYWPATVTLDPHSSGWLLQGRLIGSFIYRRQQSFAQEEGAGLQGESSRWNEAWLSWCHGKQLSGGARELVPGSVCRKGLSYRDQQLDRYVSQEPHYPLPFLPLPPFSFSLLFLFTQLSLGGMTDSHSVGPQVNFEDHEENTVLQVHSQNTRCSFSYSGKTGNPFHLTPLVFSADSLPQEIKFPAFLLYLVSYYVSNSLMFPSFLWCCLGWGNQGTPLCHWSRYEDEEVNTLFELNLK